MNVTELLLISSRYLNLEFEFQIQIVSKDAWFSRGLDNSLQSLLFWHSIPPPPPCVSWLKLWTIPGPFFLQEDNNNNGTPGGVGGGGAEFSCLSLCVFRNCCACAQVGQLKGQHPQGLGGALVLPQTRTCTGMENRRGAPSGEFTPWLHIDGDVTPTCPWLPSVSLLSVFCSQ